MKKKSSKTPAAKPPARFQAPALSDARTDGEGDTERKPQPAPLTIVGVGASAGGYEAFTQLLVRLPKNTGMAFVLVQHLDPKHESKLSELLARSSPLPLSEIRNGMKVEPDHVYVMPQNVNLSIAGGQFRLLPRKASVPHMPVDFFFRSLAENQQDHAIGIVLSGTGSDGTLGLQAIKGEGGITFAQDEKSAKYFGMPGSALAAGCVDLALPPESIAHELGRIARHPYVGPVSRPKQPKAEEEAGVEKAFQTKDDELNTLFSLLRARAGVDFSLYKHSTLKRRILRRMLLHKVDTLPEYLRYLRLHLMEVDSLFNDLLINVTGFIRDSHVWQSLKKKVFPKLMKNRAHDAPLRLWVCGCSTGEEAYSMAMSLVEHFEATHHHANVQIFATDISEAGLEKARAGIYPENISVDVSPERLRRFFTKTNGHYQVCKAIRDMCVFARQNVIVDPPFSNLDLISCRNVLIYLGQALQRKIMPVFHYALKPNGFLLLGSSETIGAFSEIFTLVDKRNKIYLKKTTLTRPGFASPQPETAGQASPARAETALPRVEAKPPDLQQYVDRLILTKFAPGAVVINAQMDALLFRGHTGNYLEHAQGSASLNLLKMARESLVLDLRTAINKAMKEDAPARQENVLLNHNRQLRFLTIEVAPFRLTPSSERFFLVLFQETGAPVPETPPVKGRQENERREMSKLRQELATNKESLQAIIEEQEATNEELKSANEEIQSSNEELQSTNEELETAKEELQSTNEELTTLNEELQTRNLELSQVNNDLTNLLGSVNVPIIMLDNDMMVRRYTPMAERIFNLIPSDVGRRLSDLNRNILAPDLDQSVREVVDNLTTVEREVQDREGRWYSLRIRPYRTHENKIDGAVILLVDINEHKRTLDLAMSVVQEPMLSLDADLRVKKANEAYCGMFQVTAPEIEGQCLYDLENGQWNIPKLRTLLGDLMTRQQQADDFEIEAEFPKIGRRKLSLAARSYGDDGKGTKLILLAIKNVTP